MGGCGAGLFLQFPLAADKGVFPLFPLAGGHLQHHLPIGIAELAHHEHLHIVGQGRHADPAGMLHHLPLGRIAVGQADIVHPQVDDAALVLIFLCYGFF